MTEKSERQKRNFWGDLATIPNLMCLYRLASLPLIVILFYTGHLMTVFILAILAPVTDLLDGIIARRFNMVTELGALLDVVSDLLFTFIALLIAVDQGIWPLYLFVVWAFRDISVLSMRWSASLLGFSIPSVLLGKISTDFIYVALVIMFLDAMQLFEVMSVYTNSIHILGLILIHIGLTLQWVTALIYFRRYYHLYQAA